MKATDETVKELLQSSRTVAVVGCSRDPEKAAHSVPKYLKEKGYRIIPVNPSADLILGEKSYKRLSDIPEPVDIVDVFRPSGEAKAIVAEALGLKPRPRAIWLQLGIREPEAEAAAEAAGLIVVAGRCIKVVHERLIG